METMREYVSRQDTKLILINLDGLDYKKDPNFFILLLEVLHRRAILMQKYAPSKLAAMSSEELVGVMNSPEILTEDIVASRSIIGDCMDILKARKAEYLAEFTCAFTDHLRKYAHRCCGCENWEAKKI